MNEDQRYITFSSWWDELIVIGIVPFFALVVFNSQVYLKLRASNQQEYRFVGRQRKSTDVPTMTVTTAVAPSSDDGASFTCLPNTVEAVNQSSSNGPLIIKNKSLTSIPTSCNTGQTPAANSDQIVEKRLISTLLYKSNKIYIGHY